ncbi:MAG TPA: YIP1 family protein, partial [Limnochordales bacterium]
MHAQPRPESRSVLTLALDVLTQPVDAFRYLAQHSHMGLGLLVYVVSQLPASLAPEWAWDGPPVAAATPGLAGVALGAISNLAELLVGALVLHGAATLLGGRNGYSKILQAEAFSALPLLLTAPFAALAHAAGAP